MAWFGNWYYFIFSLAFFAFASWTAWQIIRQKERMEDSPSWPTTTAVVISKRISERHSRYGRLFIPEIEYAYSARGKHITRTIRLKTMQLVPWDHLNVYKDSELLHKVIKATKRDLSKVAPTFEIRYNPDDPRDHICPLEEVRNDMPRLVLSLLIALFSLFLFALIRR